MLETTPAEPPAAAPLALPPWLRGPAPRDAASDTIVRPSETSANTSHGIRRDDEAPELRDRARKRGTLVHRLLQSLPDLAPERRRDAATHFLARAAESWSAADRDALTTQVLALIDDPRFAGLFAPGSRAEVAIAGRLKRTNRTRLVVSGQIDRLVVRADGVLIVDYKTNHNPPRHVSAAPVAYVEQLALYRAVLAKLYPDRPIRAALVWTETLEMMELSASALDAGLASVLSR
jgi:ATP-dependent helicase/nuclease subunit A